MYRNGETLEKVAVSPHRLTSPTLKKVHTREQIGENMSFFDTLVAAVLKADEQKGNEPQQQQQQQQQQQPQQQQQQQPQPQTQTQTQQNSEVEILKQQIADLTRQLSEAQVANRELLTNTSVAGNKSFSEIIRGESYHPLAKRGE